MKAFSFLVLFLSITTTSFSQGNMGKPAQGNMKMEDLPGVVIKNAGKDFSIYIPDRNPDASVRALEDIFIAYDLGKDYQGFENYLVIMETEKGSLTATYNKNGKLLTVVENYKNVKIPNEVIYSIYKSFPGWHIVKDKYLYSQKEGDIIKKEYNLKIKKDKETRSLVVKADGEVVKGM